MARGLYRSRPVFRRHLDHCAEALLPRLNLDLRTLIYPSPLHSDAAAKQLQQTRFAQPALFSVEYALAQMWMEWGVIPSVLLGHSLGEYVAACVAGLLSLEDALELVAARARLMQPLTGGAMLAVTLGEADVRGLARNGMSIAALNGPRQSVLSGRESAIAAVEEKLRATGVECRRLGTEHAFHSTMMEPMIDEFREQLMKVTWSKPQTEYVSNVSGRTAVPEEVGNSEYWVEHVRRTVQFAGCVEQLASSGVTVILEVGPGESLSRLVRRQWGGAWRDVMATLPAKTSMASTTGTQVSREIAATVETEAAQAEIEHGEADDDAQVQRAVGQLWTAGATIDWSAFHQPAHPHRVALPSYPFQRERFWIESASREASSAGDRRARAGTAAARQAKPETWFYLPSWRQTLRTQTPSPKVLSDYRGWIILADPGGVGEGLALRLRESGQRVVLVERGERFERVDADKCRVRGGEREDYERLLAEVMKSAGETKKKSIGVVHLWCLSEAGESHPNAERSPWIEFEQAQASGYYSLIALAQAIDKEDGGSPVNIIVAADKLHSITSEEITLPHKATMLGPCRVLPQEYRNITCRCIDVGSSESGSPHKKRLINQLLSESAESLSEVVVGYRGDQRWVQTFEPVDWTNNRATNKKLRAGGVYLILGGLEDTGQLLAEHLWEKAGAKLMLAGQRGLPPREQWQAILQQSTTNIDNDNSKSRDREAEWERRQITWLMKLAEQGAEVEVAPGDVSDEEQLREVVAWTARRFGALHGVVYAAELSGEMSFSPVGSTGVAESDRQFRWKVRTLLALEKVLQNAELDFCLIVSSLSNILGGPGYVAQAAANAFISNFVHRHNQKSDVAWTNVSWDGRQLEETKQRGAIESLPRLHFGMTTEEGSAAFARILAMETATGLLVSTGDLHARIEQWVGAESTSDGIRGQTVANTSPLHARPKLQSPYVAPVNELEQVIANVWQRALGIEMVGLEDNFFELGGDSLIAIQVIADLKRELKREIPVVSLYEGLTIKSLVSLLESNRHQETHAGAETARAEDREERTMRRKLYQEKQRFKKKEAIG